MMIPVRIASDNMASIIAGAATTTTNTLAGWESSGTGRGTLDILWSSCFTIVLCVWSSTCPNAPSANDRWRHRLIDKVNLALLGLLGPDFLLAIAFGQLTAARKSVKLFRDLLKSVRGDREWTVTHGFFANMGGFILKSPDYPGGFPIDAEQLFYLARNGYIDFPSLAKRQIGDMDKSDSLSKLITIWQGLWFIATELGRIGRGLPMTTLELTALVYAIIMAGTSSAWYCKPAITSVVPPATKNGQTVGQIRSTVRATTTYRGLPEDYHRTPLDFISRKPFCIEQHWYYYTQMTYKMMKLPLFNRPLATRPWNRFPTGSLGPATGWVLALGMALQIPFCFAFMSAWSFTFPTHAELWLWRTYSMYHAAYSLAGSLYYLLGPSASTPTEQGHNTLRQHVSGHPSLPSPSASAGVCERVRRFLNKRLRA